MTAPFTATDACTIFCGSDDVSVVDEVLRQAGAQSVGPTAELPEGTMTIARLVYTPPQDGQPMPKFSTVRAGMRNAVHNGVEVVDGAKEQVQGVLARCRLALGIRFDPALGQLDQRADVVFKIAAATDGVVFDGFSVLDAARNRLVDVSR